MGLSICRAIIEAHDGRLWVAPNTPRGAVFQFTLPLQRDEQRLAELVTNIYLSDGKKREKLWVQAEETMLRLKVPKKRIEHLIKTKDPALIAEVVKELEAGTLKRETAPPAQR
jgi:ligand-binding sensor domain-containing protein